METNVQNPSSEAMLNFAMFLRDNPDAAAEDPSHLSARFGLPEEIIKESLKLAQNNITKNSIKVPSALIAKVVNGWNYIKAICSRHALISSSFLAVLFLLVTVITDTWQRSPGNALMVFGICFSIVFLMLINFWRGQARYSLVTSFIFISVFYVLRKIIESFPFIQKHMTPDWVVLPIVILALTFVLSVLVLFVSLAGALWNLRLEAQAEVKQNRLQLLQRIFDIQDKLETTPLQETKKSLHWKWLSFLRKNWLFVSLICGFLLGLVILIQALTVGFIDPLQPPELKVIAFSIFHLILLIVLFMSVGFVAGNWHVGLLSGLILFGFQFWPYVLPIKDLSFNSLFTKEFASEAFWTQFFLLLFLSMLAGIGGKVEEEAQRKKRLQKSEHAALLAELIRLQGRLSGGVSDVCAVVVDCVKSTEIKRNSDALSVEISFREFHEYINNVALKYGGVIRSTAGDSAIVEFLDVQSAFHASQALQKGMADFNAKYNRLSQPFQIRIGIHCGKVNGNLVEVQFSRVIDIAAHIEKIAPSGGIVVTDSVHEMLPDEKFIALEDPVDGHKVFLAVEPQG